MRVDCVAELNTESLQSSVEQLRATMSLDKDATDLADRWLLSVCAVSPYVARICKQYPTVISALFNSGDLQNPVGFNADKQKMTGEKKPARCCADLVDELEHDLQTLTHDRDIQLLDSRQIEALQQKTLRVFRHRHMVRILWCDLTGVATLTETLNQLSLLADACIIVAERWSYAALCSRYGVPCDSDGRQQHLIVLGMGKLGGFELNVSSDIDLICVWPDAGQTVVSEDRQKSVDNSEFFRRQVQRLTVLLNSVTEDGFVFRVDTRLRPFGESGPLVMNFDGIEHYYLTQARDWERYAMIKARAITGNGDDIRALEQLIIPFVYRRYLDYAAFEALRDLKRKIALSVLQKGMIDNIKLGSGGIREIEFIGQAFQLVRGGRDTRFQIRPIVDVLKLLAELNLMETEEVDGLLAAYAYLRQVENGVQMMRDEQVHSLPSDISDQQRLLMIMDEPDWDLFKQRLSKHQQRVAESFAVLFESEAEQSVAEDTGPSVATSDDDSPFADAWSVWAMLCEPDIDQQRQEQLLSDAGFEPG